MIEGVVRTGLADDAEEREVGHDANKEGGEECALHPVFKRDFPLGRFHRRKERHKRTD